MQNFSTQVVKTSLGFTLIELLLVISIFSIIAVMSTSFYSRFLTQNDNSNTVDQLVGELRKAQLYAMMGKQNSAWGVNFSSNKITLFKGATFGLDNSFNEVFSINPNVNISGMTTISFARFTGLPTPAGPISVTVSAGGNSKTVTMNAQGVTSK